MMSSIGLALIPALASVSFILCAPLGVRAQEFRLNLPVDCKIGETCFLQQLPDLDEGPGISDPFCGSATYDQHKGTDIRVLSMKDIAERVPVIAAQSGVVKNTRDSMPDRLVRTGADMEAVSGRECGNGVVINHGNGYETQYCHMMSGGLTVEPGEKVEAGDTLGFIGASGMAQFPHLHFQLRRNGTTIDPFTAKPVGEACGASGKSYWSDPSLFEPGADAQLLKAGLASSAVDYDLLVENGGPPQAQAGEEAVVGWTWFANLRKGDRIAMRLTGPSGLISESASEPLDQNKADYNMYAGKRRTVVPGSYEIITAVIRNGKPLRQYRRAFTVE